MASRKAKELAAKHERDRRRLEALGIRGAKRLSIDLRSALIKSIKTGAPVSETAGVTLGLFANLITEGMLAADLAGRLRTRTTIKKDKAAKGLALTRTPTVYNRAVAVMQARLKFTNSQVSFLRDQYSVQASQIAGDIGDISSQELSTLVADAVEAGEPPLTAARNLRMELRRVGLDPGNPYQLETIFRTQTVTAYSAARWQALQDPDAQELIWGFEYSTVGDDKVRPEHAAMDALRLPKNDPRWSILWPPNGWNCRCTTIEILFGDPLANTKPPRDRKIGGVLVSPIPDEGWSFNPGEVFNVPQLVPLLG